MKIKNYTVPTIHRKKVGIGKFDIPHTNKHDRSWLSRSISIKCDGVKLVLWTQTYPLSEMMNTTHLLVFYLLFTFSGQTGYYFVLFVYADMLSIYKTT